MSCALVTGVQTFALPIFANRLAEASGIDLNKVQGSGPGGRVVKADLEGAAASPAAVDKAASAPAGQAPAPAEAAGGEIPPEVIKLSSMRTVIDRRLTESTPTVDRKSGAEGKRLAESVTIEGSRSI